MSLIWRRKLFKFVINRVISRPENRYMRTFSRQKILLHETPTTSIIRQMSSTGRKKSFLWEGFKKLSLLTGGLFWMTVTSLSLAYSTGFIKVEIEEEELQQNGNNSMNSRIENIFDLPINAEQHVKHKEMTERSSAFVKIWNQLSNEEGIIRNFGGPAYVIGLVGNIEQTSENNFDSNSSSDDAETLDDEKNSKNENDENLEWSITSVVGGPKLTGILEVQFSKVDSEWIPVSVRLEGMETTGKIICDISGPLPNGVSRFTRLSND